MASSRRRATLSISSRRTTAKVEAVNPCLREFWAARTLPSGERGPVERAALARLAASFLSETGFLVRVIGRSVLSYSMGEGGSLKLGKGKRGRERSYFCRVAVNVKGFFSFAAQKT